MPDTAEPHLVPSPALPSTEDVIRKTEQITKNIQELLRAAQESKHDRYREGALPAGAASALTSGCKPAHLLSVGVYCFDHVTK